MIRIILLGRTGNLLFQYALGRVLAERHGVSLVMDASWYNPEGWSEVSHFLKLPLNARIIRPISPASRALRNLTGKHFWEYLPVPFLRESPTDQSFSQDLLDAPSDSVLFGYFQTPLYFGGMEDRLRGEMRDLIATGGGAACSTRHGSGEIAHASAVAVHVRRGDYLRHPHLQVCGEGYYRRAMARLRSDLPGARFFVFSDDPAWCLGRFKAEDTQVIGEANPNPLCDLHLMSLASHHIIANSSYSWWAAWLGRKPGQRVIMPGRWYADRSIIAPIHEKRLPHWDTIPMDEDWSSAGGPGTGHRHNA
jgi:hypothetical protein